MPSSYSFLYSLLVVLQLGMTECQAQNQRQVDDPNSIPYMVAYKPAAGYYICPEEGLVCTIVNCWEEEGCDDFMFKFDRVPNVINRDDEEVFVSMGEHSSITLAYGDAEMIICDTPTTSTSPSSPPSDVPSSFPSDLPSSSPSLEPSASPSEFPTLSPTIDSPIPNLLKKLSGNKVLDLNTPQNKAALWMSQYDQLDYNVTEEDVRLVQRYAMVAMDFAFHENDGSRLNWSDPMTDECTWDGVTCARFSGINHVRTINWARRNLTGTVLPEIELLPALETLDLATNHIEGPLDPFYSLKFLKNLYLFQNSFSGTIATEVGNLNRLERLYIGYNKLSGTFPMGLVNPNRDRPLQWLIMHHNNFEGELPMGMRLGHLRYFDISNNRFNGTIPSDWPDRLLTMRSLYLSNNQLRGTIPENFARIGKGWLKQFYADGNKLRGRFPSGWDPIWYLTNIDVRDNQLTRIPSSVCSMNVFNRAEMVELRANCDICDCGRLCDNCD